MCELLMLGHARTAWCNGLPDALGHSDNREENDQEQPTRVCSHRDQQNAQQAGHDAGALDPTGVAQTHNGEHGEEDDDTAAQEDR